MKEDAPKRRLADKILDAITHARQNEQHEIVRLLEEVQEALIDERIERQRERREEGHKPGS